MQEAMTTTLRINDVDYEWIYGKSCSSLWLVSPWTETSILESNEGGKFRLGDTRVINGFLFYVSAVLRSENMFKNLIKWKLLDQSENQIKRAKAEFLKG